MYRVNRQGDGLDDADTIEGARQVVPGQPPGRYHIDQICAELLPSCHTSRRWGVGIKRPDGSVTLDPDPWPDR
jgi:hypothetical protein